MSDGSVVASHYIGMGSIS